MNDTVDEAPVGVPDPFEGYCECKHPYARHAPDGGEHFCLVPGCACKAWKRANV